MMHNLRFFFSLKCRLFHNAAFFCSCIIHILNLKGNSGAKGLMIVTGIMISLFLRNENFNRSIALNKIIFNFKMYLCDKEEYLGQNVIYLFINSFIIWVVRFFRFMNNLFALPKRTGDM